MMRVQKGEKVPRLAVASMQMNEANHSNPNADQRGMNGEKKHMKNHKSQKEHETTDCQSQQQQDKSRLHIQCCNKRNKEDIKR
jgi:hypothetical protein